MFREKTQRELAAALARIDLARPAVMALMAPLRAQGPGRMVAP